MRYVIYGVDATSQSPCPPLTVDAHSEEEARDRAVARGMAVRAVMADAAAVPPAEPALDDTRFVPRDAPAAEPDKTPGAQRPVRMVLLPLAIAFFLVLALARSAVQAATWAFVWGLGLLLGGGLTGLFRWLSRGAAPVETCWPIGVAAGLTVISAAYGWRAGWQWWRARGSLGPLAQALGIAPEQEADDDPIAWRMAVMFAQGFAGAVLGTLGSLAGWASDWGLLTVVAWCVAGALGLGMEGAILGVFVARRQPIVLPGAATSPAYDSLTWLLGRTGIGLFGIRSPIVASALDRAVPGAVAGTIAGVAACILWRLL